MKYARRVIKIQIHRVGDGCVHTAVFKMNKQPGPPASHRELCSMLSAGLGGRGLLGENVLSA